MSDTIENEDGDALSQAEHLGILVAGTITLMEQERDRAREWAVRLEQELNAARTLVADLADLATTLGTTWVGDSRRIAQANEFLNRLDSLESPDDEEPQA